MGVKDARGRAESSTTREERSAETARKMIDAEEETITSLIQLCRELQDDDASPQDWQLLSDEYARIVTDLQRAAHGLRRAERDWALNEREGSGFTENVNDAWTHVLRAAAYLHPRIKELAFDHVADPQYARCNAELSAITELIDARDAIDEALESVE